MIPVLPAPLVMFVSPSGWPSFARAADEANTGIEDLHPRIVVDGSHCETALRTRGWKKNRENALTFSVWAIHRSTRHDLIDADSHSLIWSSAADE